MPAPRGLSSDDIDTLRTGLAGGRRPKVVFTAAAGQMAGQTGQVTALGDPETADEWISVRFGKDKLEFAPTDLQLPGRSAGRSARPRRESAATAPTPTPAPPAPAATTGRPAEPPAGRRPARRTTTRKATPDLSVTLTWHDGDWSVQAARGSRTIAKPTPVRATDALRMVGMLDAPAVADAVTEIVTAARTEAAEKAETLRRELAEVEARLADLPDLG